MIKAKETAVVGSPVWEEAVRSLVLMMAPIFPHIAEEMWQQVAKPENGESVHVHAWPQGDAEKAKEDEITVVVQVNGKVRDKLTVAPGTAKDMLESQALASPNVQNWLDGKQGRKVIVVPNKLVNIVVG
jgi:leucyl-tRNA synthetase